MSTNGTDNLHVSQGFDVLQPKSGKAYPVPCDEWQFLKEKLSTAKYPPWIAQALASLLFGASLTTLMSILLGDVASSNSGIYKVIAWAAFATTGIIGIAFLFFAIAQYRIKRTQVSEVIRQMELIEARFETKTGQPAA
jgi:hypothetical protein